MIKFIRIFLLVLIIIGIGLLVTQKMWVPGLVERIISKDKEPEVIFETPESILSDADIKDEVVKDFEGEADPSRMTLGMNAWNWIKTNNADGSSITPKKSGVFILQFKNDKTFSASTDCNGIGGEYKIKDKQISFEKMMSTLMYCESSQESEFSTMLSSVKNYEFTSRGELILVLDTGGSMIFR